MATQRLSSSTSEVSKKRKRDHSSSPHWNHEVFLSFHGKDTRWGFTGHLHDALKRKGILLFRDDETLKQGEYVSKALRKAIQKSQYIIVILSENYTSSKWCLRELAEIVEWEKKTKLITIIPIFYYVDPSDVRNQKGTFAKAFAAHEKDPKVDIKEIDMWKKAFSKVGNIKGEHIHDRYESTIIQDISRRISRELNSRFSHHDYKKLVAIDSQVDKMMELLDMESNDVRFVGIHGMSGVGKTTLAEIIYDRVSNSNCRFEGSSFISCIREKSTTARDLASLQKELLSTIMQEKIRVYNHHQGIGMIIKMLQNKRVFIVLDDVDSVEQLTTLAGDRKWFGPGSRVIITCRDSHLLRTHEVNGIYKVEQLETTEALQLFSLSAFNMKTHPPENYKALSMDFVKYCQGLPLALKVLGSFLFGREIDAWKSVRDQLEANPNKEIMDVLQISFDGLKYSQKELFLDMASFFKGQEIFSEMLLEIFGHYHIDLEVLVEKSLIRKSEYGWLFMHDLLKELGRDIVRRECPDEPGRRSRLFRVEDLYHVLKNDTGTDATKAIVPVDFCPETKDQILRAQAFSKMTKLRYLKFDNSQTIKWSGDPLKYMPTNELRFLEWTGYHLNSWPSSFQPKNLTVLRMRGSRIEQLWMGSMVLPNLKEFDLSNSENLIETPDLTGVPNLADINLDGCRSLCEIHPSIGSLKKLKSLTLNECSSLEKLPDLSRRLECLTYLGASETAITQILPSSFQPENLTVLRMHGSRMKQLWKGLMVLPNLKSFDLRNSKNLIESPDLTGVPNLEAINLEDCRSLCELHPSIGSLKKLTSLGLDKCSSLEELPDLSSLECLLCLWASKTAITQILPSIFQPENLTILTMSGSRMKQLWKGLMVLPNLNEFDLSNSENLIETPDLTGCPNLERINLDGCRSLCEVHPSIGSLKKLNELKLDYCSSLEKLPDLSSLECLFGLWAWETAITQIPSVNLMPKSDICGFNGSKLMRLKSRDPIYDIGSLVEYQKEGTYDSLEAAWIDFDSKGENILDMAGVVISALDDNLKMIGGWSLGFHIPEWVQYKSNGSSVKIDLDANTNPEMGCAFFIVCDYDQFISDDQLGYIYTNWNNMYRSKVKLKLVFEMDEEYYVELEYGIIPPIWNVSFGKRIGFWVYIPEVLRFLDIRRRVMIFEIRSCYYSTGFEGKEVEVKECGVHLVCPDDANSNFFNSIAPFGCSGFSNSDFHRKFDAFMRKKKKREIRKRKLKMGGGS